MENLRKKQIFWWMVIAGLILIVSVLHYTTSTTKWQYHLIFMQSYFIPILIAAFQFGIRGGLGTAIVVSIIYFPHIMLQWGGLAEGNLMRFMQIFLFNIIGYLTGLKAQNEMDEKSRYQKTAEELEKSLFKLREQSEKMDEMEEQLRLADRLSVIGELTASLAHEVRNPLGSIRGAVEILRDELPQTEQTSEFLQILVEETERLSGVVENYLSFSRSRKQEISSIDVREIVRNVGNLLNSRARKEEISIRLDMPETPLLVEINPNQLRQILVNLAMNSIQATASGGEITLKAEICSARESKNNASRETVRMLCLSVIDKGSGIEETELEKIFLPFYTNKADGTGLGLAIVKRIADQNNWQIRAKSRPGEGTDFSIFIPLRDSQDH